MQHKGLMRVTYRRTDFAKELQQMWNGQILVRAIPVNGLSANVLHHEVGTPLFGRSGIQQLRHAVVLK